MSMLKDKIVNYTYDAGLITLCAIPIGVAVKSFLKTELGAPKSRIGIGKMTV